MRKIENDNVGVRSELRSDQCAPTRRAVRRDRNRQVTENRSSACQLRDRAPGFPRGQAVAYVGNLACILARLRGGRRAREHDVVTAPFEPAKDLRRTNLPAGIDRKQESWGDEQQSVLHTHKPRSARLPCWRIAPNRSICPRVVSAHPNFSAKVRTVFLEG